MEIQIMEFGQIPKQLFTRPHPMRYGPREIPRSLSSLSDTRETNSQDKLTGRFTVIHKTSLYEVRS